MIFFLKNKLNNYWSSFGKKCGVNRFMPHWFIQVLFLSVFSVSENSAVIIKIMGFPFDDNFVFGDNFFSWLIIFFSPKATKKITQPRKKITHQQTKLLIQRKPHYIYDMTFLCPPSPLFFFKIGEKIWVHYIKITKKNYHDKKKIITCHLYRNSRYNILERDNCFFFVIIVFCNFFADYKAQKKNSYHKKKQLSRIMDPN